MSESTSLWGGRKGCGEELLFFFLIIIVLCCFCGGGRGFGKY